MKTRLLRNHGHSAINNAMKRMRNSTKVKKKVVK